MSIGIAKVRVDEARLIRDSDGMIVKGEYALISDKGAILAKQGFNGYNDIKVVSSQETIRLMQEIETSIERDLNLTLGFKEDKK